MTTLREQFHELDNDRSFALARKREHAKLTKPYLLPPQGMSQHQALDVPYSMLNAEGINALSSRIMSVVFPLNGQSIFNIIPDTTFQPEGRDDTEMAQAMARFERQVMDNLAPTNLREAAHLAYQHLITIGDCLLFQSDSMDFRIFRLDQYVVMREHEGEWREIIIQEGVNPKWHKELQSISGPVETLMQGATTPWESLYTHVKKEENGSITVTQEFRETTLPNPKTYKVSPYMPMRWNALAGEPYGISLVEDSFGDIRHLDALKKALQDGVLLNAEYRWGVNPAGLTELADLMNSENGDWLPATQQDVFPLQFQNAAQVQGAQIAVVHAESMLGRRYLMNSAVQPQGERVTARQVNLLAQELESNLGGVLSTASSSLQEPVIRRTIALMAANNKIPSDLAEQLELKDGFVKLRIRAGLEILNREAEREKLDAAIERMRNLPPDALAAFNWPEIARDWWQSLGLEDAGRIKTPQQMQAEQQQAQQQQLAMQAAQAAAQQGIRQPQGEQQ